MEEISVGKVPKMSMSTANGYAGAGGNNNLEVHTKVGTQKMTHTQFLNNVDKKKKSSFNLGFSLTTVSRKVSNLKFEKSRTPKSGLESRRLRDFHEGKT